MPMVTSPEECNCFAVRAAARHITQVYDQVLAPSPLVTTQFSELPQTKWLGWPAHPQMLVEGHGGCAGLHGLGRTSCRWSGMV